MLEEELVDLVTFCLQNPGSNVHEQERRITEIGRLLYADGGVDAMENFFHVVRNRVNGEIKKDPLPLRSLWNGITSEWQYYQH